MPSDLVQRLRNLHAHSGDPDTVDEAAATLESLEGVCSASLANIQLLGKQVGEHKAHIDRLEELCREQAKEIEHLKRTCDTFQVYVEGVEEMGYEWRWTRSIDADGRQEGVWFKAGEQ